MQTCGSGVICFSAAVWGPAALHGWSPLTSALFNLDLLLLSHHIAVIALVPRPRRLKTSPPKAQRERPQDPLVLVSSRRKLAFPQHFTSLHESSGKLNDTWLSL